MTAADRGGRMARTEVSEIMGDEIDLANDHAAMFTEQALAARKKPAPIPKGNGRCWLCEIDVEGDRRFCGRECADEWEANQV